MIGYRTTHLPHHHDDISGGTPTTLKAEPGELRCARYPCNLALHCTIEHRPRLQRFNFNFVLRNFIQAGVLAERAPQSRKLIHFA